MYWAGWIPDSTKSTLELGGAGYSPPVAEAGQGSHIFLGEDKVSNT